MLQTQTHNPLPGNRMKQLPELKWPPNQGYALPEASPPPFRPAFGSSSVTRCREVLDSVKPNNKLQGLENGE